MEEKNEEREEGGKIYHEVKKYKGNKDTVGRKRWKRKRCENTNEKEDEIMRRERKNV